jgi:hypothetical protein
VSLSNFHICQFRFLELLLLMGIVILDVLRTLGCVSLIDLDMIFREKRGVNILEQLEPKQYSVICYKLTVSSFMECLFRLIPVMGFSVCLADVEVLCCTIYTESQ